MGVFRQEYIDALRLLAQVCEVVAARGLPRPILVGGGAVEFHTGGAVTTGDFDFVTPHGPEFENLLPRFGFIEEEKFPGWRMRTFRHPQFDLGVDVIDDCLYPGSDVARVRLVEIVDGKRIPISPIEDLIADRLGQFTVEDRAEAWGQAVLLYQLAFDHDGVYLDARIREQTQGEWWLSRFEEELHGRSAT